MATQSLLRSLLSKPKLFPYSRHFSSMSSPPTTAAAALKTSITPSPASSLSFIRRFGIPVWTPILRRDFPTPAFRSLSTRATRSSLSDPNPNYSNRPPKETILLDGCDFEHWLVVMEPPKEDATRDDIIDSYIKTLAKVVGSEDEARMKIYSVSTRHYYAFGALVSEELSYKLKELEGVRWVLPDSYLDVRNKDYGGEPFINGQAVPYDPKYHEEWVRNNARANERNRRNDRPRNYDRSRNYERRRENMQQNRGPPPNAAGMPPPNAAGMPPPNAAGMPPPNAAGMPPPNAAGMPPNNIGGGMPPNNIGGGMPPNNMGGGMPPNNMGGMPQNNSRMQQNMGNVPPNQGWNGNMPGSSQNFQSSPNPGNSPYQGAPPNAQYQGNYPPPNAQYQSNYPPQNAQYQGNYPPPNAPYQDNYGPNMGGRNMPGGN